MKKKLLAVLLTAGMILGMTACGNGSGDGGSSSQTASTPSSEASGSSESDSSKSEASKSDGDHGEQVTLRMAWWGSQKRHDLTVEIIEMYEKDHPNINIEYEFFSFDDYFTKLKTLVASDQVWDIFQLGGNFPMYLDKIYYVDEFIDSGVIETAGLPETYQKLTQDTQGHQIGLSTGLNTYAIAYDVDMFNDAGVPLPAQNWTWDDYADAARKIHEKTGHYGTSGLASSEFIAGCSCYISQYGKVGQYSFFNLDLTGMGFDDASMLEPYIQMRADLIKEGAAPDAGAETEVTNIENDFLVTGEAAMTWVAVNQFPTIYDICKEEGRNLALATLPRITPDGPSGAVIQSSAMMCVSQDSKNKEEAAAFISWFQNSTECNDVLQGERGIPVNTQVRESLKAQATDAQKVMYDFVDLVGTFEIPEKINVLSPDGQDELVDKYRNYIQQVAFGEITASQAAEKTYADAQAIFSK